MSSKNIVAAVVVAMGLGTGLATVAAIPANAAPSDSPVDPVFVKTVREKGLRMKSDSFAIDLAHSTCDVLARGGSTEDALLHVKNATGWKDVKDVGLFGGLAVQAYCPGTLPK
jgi:hypothetical protein